MSWPGRDWTRSSRRPRPAWPATSPAPSGWLRRALRNEPMPRFLWTKLWKVSDGDIVRNPLATALAALLLGTGWLTLVAPLSHAASTTLAPVADSHVQADAPTTNFGTATSLRIDGDPVSKAYLKFDVQGLSTAPTRATLKVVSPISSTTPINAKSVTDTTWTETGVTYNNAPAVGATVASATPSATNSVLSFDVTSLVKGNGLVSFALDTTSSTSKSPPSRENPTVEYRPQLVVETGTTSTPADPIRLDGDRDAHPIRLHAGYTVRLDGDSAGWRRGLRYDREVLQEWKRHRRQVPYEVHRQPHQQHGAVAGVRYGRPAVQQRQSG